MAKKFMDLSFAVCLLPAALVLCLIAVFLIRFESPGNPIFSQRRVGKNQVPFTLFKLRTMSIGTENLGSHEISSEQITKVGKLLRRTKIDELPQVINVLLGQMSFVGPRPCLPNQLELINKRQEKNVFSVVPGITGPAQLSGIDMSTPLKLADADAAYIAARSLKGDLKLIVRTALGSGRGDAAIG